LISFKWSGTSWSYAGIQDSPGELKVNDIEGNRKIISRLEPHQAYETLGVYLAPDGNSMQQVAKLTLAVKTWMDNLRTGVLTRSDVWLALHSTILRTLSYPLPALRLSRVQWDEILSPLLRYCLPAMGVCRNFPRALVFSSLDYMGVNIQHLHTLQEIARLKDIILHTFNDTLTGRLYVTSMELFFIKLGLPSNLICYDIAVLDGLTTNSLVK